MLDAEEKNEVNGAWLMLSAVLGTRTYPSASVAGTIEYSASKIPSNSNQANAGVPISLQCFSQRPSKLLPKCLSMLFDV